MEERLFLTKKTAYTVYSSDDEMRASNKGCYKNYDSALANAPKSGWYGSDGEVREVTVYEDSNGNIYELKDLGQYTDVAEQIKDLLLSSIKSKLTPQELAFLKVK